MPDRPGSAPSRPSIPSTSRSPARPAQVSRTGAGEPATVLEAVAEALWEEMERDERVFLMGEDIGAYGGAFKVTKGFLDRFGPLRVVDTPISEGGFTGAAAGAAHMGLRPVVEMQFMDFVSPAYDVLTNYVATSRYRGAGPLPMVVRGPVGGGARGGPFHSQNVEMAFFHTPGLKIVYPSNPRDAKGLLKSAIRDDDPVIFEEHKVLYRAPPLPGDSAPGGLCDSPRKGPHRPRGRGPDDRLLRHGGAPLPGGREGAGQGRSSPGGRGSAHAPAARRRSGGRVGQEDGQVADRARGHPHGRDRRRDRDARQRAGVRMAGRARSSGSPP